MYNIASKILCSQYGLNILSIKKVPSGWSASAWKVHTDQGNYFLKVYDKQSPTARSWIARIDTYMPVVRWLNENTELRNKMVAPILTKKGYYKCEDDIFLYILYPYINGQTISNTKLKPGQARELAKIIAVLHSYGAEIPVPTSSLTETFDISFCAILNNRLENIQNSILEDVLKPCLDTISREITNLQNTSLSLGRTPMRFALCHTDIHGWNLMQSNRLILIDWEGLKLAPVEADLFSFTETFFFGYAWEEFMSSYRTIHKDYKLNYEALRFYRYRRRLEDIYEFAESILVDSLTKEEESRALEHLARECSLLNEMD